MNPCGPKPPGPVLPLGSCEARSGTSLSGPGGADGGAGEGANQAGLGGPPPLPPEPPEPGPGLPGPPPESPPGRGTIAVPPAPGGDSPGPRFPSWDPGTGRISVGVSWMPPSGYGSSPVGSSGPAGGSYNGPPLGLMINLPGV